MRRICYLRSCISSSVRIWYIYYLYRFKQFLSNACIVRNANLSHIITIVYYLCDFIFKPTNSKSDDQCVIFCILVNFTQLLELILGYAASKEEWEMSSSLRLVSKRWRSLSFKGLGETTDLPELCLWDHDHVVCKFPSSCHINFQSFLTRFPVTTPDTLTLSQPVLPFKLSIPRFPTTEEFSFIRERASHITAVRVLNYPGVSGSEEPFRPRNVDGQLDSNLRLPNVQSIHVG